MARHEVDSLGGSVTARPGDEVVLSLPENPTTGYRWEIEAPGRSVEVADDAYDRGRDQGIGAGGRRTFTLRVGDGGAVEVQLRLARAWEADAIEAGSLGIVIEPDEQ